MVIIPKLHKEDFQVHIMPGRSGHTLLLAHINGMVWLRRFRVAEEAADALDCSGIRLLIALTYRLLNHDLTP